MFTVRVVVSFNENMKTRVMKMTSGGKKTISSFFFSPSLLCFSALSDNEWTFSDVPGCNGHHCRRWIQWHGRDGQYFTYH